MAVIIEKPNVYFLALVTIYFAFFSFILGIALAASGNLAVGLSLLLANVLTITSAILLYFFKGVSFQESNNNQKEVAV
jgi:hypothetical protein